MGIRKKIIGTTSLYDFFWLDKMISNINDLNIFGQNNVLFFSVLGAYHWTPQGLSVIE